MPDHKPPPPETLVDTLPDLPEPPLIGTPRAVTVAKYTEPMLTLPQIVSQIREQKPGVVPECFDFVQEVPAVFVLEAALWRALSKKRGCSVDLRHWGWFATAERQTGGGLCFGHDPLALIRAICHAIGVTLTAPDWPHRRTTRDASGATVCLDCQEDISRG